MRRTLFQGAPSVKRVDHYRHLKVEAEVVPVVVVQDGKDIRGKDELQWGIIFQCTPQKLLQETEDEDRDMEPFELDETFDGWSNPVRWWRALQLIEAMPVLDDRNVGLEMWIATGRPDTDEQFEQERIADLRDTMTEGYSYEEIMARPVPLEIVQLAIQFADEGFDMSRMEYDMSDEIKAGTIRWSKELERIGVKHPDYHQAVSAAKHAIIKRYTAHLFSWADFWKCPYDHDRKKKGWGMISIEWGLYDAVERGIEQAYGMDITMLVATLYAMIAIDTNLENHCKKHPREEYGGKPFVRVPLDERFEEVLTWITTFPQAGVLPSKNDLKETLHHLYEQFESMPIVNPLVR